MFLIALVLLLLLASLPLILPVVRRALAVHW